MGKSITRRSGFLAACAAVLALGMVPATAGAAVLLYETFTYPDGNLVGNGGWAAHSGAGLKPIQVTAGQAILQQSTGSGEDVNTLFAAQGAAAKTYFSLDVTVPAGTVGTGAEYFVHIRNSLNFIYPARVFLGPPLAGGNFTLGIKAGSTSVIAWWPSDFSFGSTHKLVASYDAVTGTVELWVDPATELSPKVTSTVGGAIGDLIDSIALRQAAPAGATLLENIDNILVGQSFGDVTTPPTAVDATSWGRVKNAYR